MSEIIFQLIYLAGIFVETAIRVPFNRERRKSKIAVNRVDRKETLLLLLLFLGSYLAPLLKIFTPWLDFADYTLPVWAGWLGVILLLAAVLLFWRSHVDLGRNWSPTLQLREGHALVTEGVYRYIRHPMYASQWLWVMAQALLLQNWIAGLGGIVCFTPFYFMRVAPEEQMMLEKFGEEYRACMQRTGRLLPRWR
ncbi:protein-S-isoprenylcysteine O-methyltransferase [Caldilinea sp.]|uniref:protein-S-isoprenylcysteine O-methyltransferase n=1 Tax=Caldilinea sp. TaxID=2293560 RepID=UPI0021DBCD0C|nr:protein-S-isoprenylcysteine O-methyltransferase [Caldilinea sp.]GIV71253.1 MAG: isoprenylcysteine carboxyl methyltransferase [Caldilinea sp.]